MCTPTFRAALFFLVLTVFAAPARAVTYVATLLHPAAFDDSWGYGVAGTSQVGDGYFGGASYYTHALLWNGTAASKVDLSPPTELAIFDTFARGVSGTTQVGYGYTGLGGGPTHALMWSGTAASAVDLNPPDYVDSAAYGVSGANQVGDGTRPLSGTHAVLWSGTAATVEDLNNPLVSLESHGRAISGTTQVGWGAPAPLGGYINALMWSGTAASEVNLAPGNYNSYAYGVSGDSQVGEASGTGYPHATLWHGTPESMIELHPAGFQESGAYAVAGMTQVGYGKKTFSGSYHMHALAWSGTSASVVDLHPLLAGLGTFTDSEAHGISDTGDIVGHAYNAAGHSFAVVWKRTSLIGDFNGDGRVDAGDFVAWTKAGRMPPGFDADWCAHFGEAAGGSGASANTVVPEPATLVLLMFAAAECYLWRGRDA